jgi:hypothetical protein
MEQIMHGGPLSGDIIFSSGNVVASGIQSVLRGVRVNWSHVMISINQAGAIHAMPKTGVTIASWSELFPGHPLPDFLVLRAPDASLFDFHVFHRAAEYYLARYNTAFMFRNFPGLKRRFMTSFFCSELAAQICIDKGLDLGVSPMRILPIDLVGLLQRERWADVSEIYRPYLLGNTKSSSENEQSLQSMRQVFGFLQSSKRQLRAAQALHARVDAFIKAQLLRLEIETEQLRNLQASSGSDAPVWLKRFRKLPVSTRHGFVPSSKPPRE